MKKVNQMMLVFLVLTLSSLFAMADERVNRNVENNFKQDFQQVENLHWNKANDIWLADFMQNSKRMIAYYTERGELLGVGTYIEIEALPAKTRKNLEARFSGAEIKELFEYADKENGTRYYAKIQNDTHVKVVELSTASGRVIWKKRLQTQY